MSCAWRHWRIYCLTCESYLSDTSNVSPEEMTESEARGMCESYWLHHLMHEPTHRGIIGYELSGPDVQPPEPIPHSHPAGHRLHHLNRAGLRLVGDH
jgi:hypothetical protein